MFYPKYSFQIIKIQLATIQGHANNGIFVLISSYKLCQ